MTVKMRKRLQAMTSSMTRNDSPWRRRQLPETLVPELLPGSAVDPSSWEADKPATSSATAPIS
jgi:hypothetical protein